MDAMPSELREPTTESQSSGVFPVELRCYVEDLVARGGPEPHEYAEFSGWIDRVAEAVASGVFTKDDVLAMARDLVGRELRGTFWSHVLFKPHGYAGDFEIIDAMYRQAVHPDPRLSRWDLYFHTEAAPRAVRNRKAYLHAQLRRLCVAKADKPLRMLNVASGPGRDITEWFDRQGCESLLVDCVELDPLAIAYTRKLCNGRGHALRFHQANALRFSTEERYDLVWSAGLFDYLNDGLFVKLLRRLLRFTKPGGELVIGNFGNFNPTRNCMELLCDWNLIHREGAYLSALAMDAGADADAIFVGKEPEGINHFLHIRR